MVEKLTSHGGGALRYDGTILKVTDPRASRCVNKTKERITIILIKHTIQFDARAVILSPDERLFLTSIR